MADENAPPPEPPADGLSELQGLDPGELLARGLHTVKPTGGASGWEPPTPEEVGRLLPHYRIEKLIGRGGMGAVYKGIQLNLDRPVAIKLLPTEIAADAEFVTRFEREARTLARLQHSRIITIHDFGRTREGHLYFVMEYIDGTDLRRILKGPGLDPEQALAVVGQLCDALQAAHREGIVHRDIKPENVLITKDGYVKLADFGLSRPPQEDGISQLTSTNVIMGTPEYMAPEQRDGAAKADHRSDIFALGVMFYEMLTGKPPRGIFDRPSLKVRVDVRIDAVVIKALQSEPDRRYQQVSEMKTAVDRIRNTPPPAAPSVKPPRPASPTRKPNKALPVIAAIMVLVIGLPALVAGLWWTRNSGPARKTNEPVVARNRVMPPVVSTTTATSPPQTALADDAIVGRWRFYNGDLRDFKADGKCTGGNSGVGVANHGGVIAMWTRGNPNQTPARYTIKYLIGDFQDQVTLDANCTSLEGQSNHGEHVTASRLSESSPPAGGSSVVAHDSEAQKRSSPNAPQQAAADRVWMMSVGVRTPVPTAPPARVATSSSSPSTTVEKSVPATTALAATKDAPFVNALGMKFVPVPIPGGPTGGQRVLFSSWDTRVQDYEAFVKESRREWPKPDFEQAPTHPAVNMTWEDAQLFCQWLTAREQAAGRLPVEWRYRLPSDHEWSCAVGLGSRENPATLPSEKSGKNTDAFPWGKPWPPPKGAGNYAGEEIRPALAAGKYTFIKQVVPGYNDGFVNTSPVGSFDANEFGLFDMGGNVWQWCENRFYNDRNTRVLRGASWNAVDRSKHLLSSVRFDVPPGTRADDRGFRCVLDVSAPAASVVAPVAITKPTTPGTDLRRSVIGRTLLSKPWRWHNAPGKDYNELLTLRPDGTGSLEAGQKLPTGYEFHKAVRWTVIDEHTAWMVFAAKHEEFDPNKSGFWVKLNDPSPEKFFGYSDYDNSQVGFGVAESDAGRSGAPTAQAETRGAKEGAIGSSLPGIVSKPGSSHLQNFVDQMPLVEAWALAPLDIVVPPAVLENATLLKTGLTVEGRRRPQTLQTAYTRGVYFCGLLIGILQEKDTLFSRSGGRLDQRPWDGGISEWSARAAFVRPMLEVAGKQFGEALQAAGGLPTITDGAADSGLLAKFPAMGTPFPKPPPGPPGVSLEARGPVGGTNFGWGERKLTVHVAVHTDSDKPLPVTVDCYWVGWDGKHHTTSKPYHQAIDVTKDHGADFDFATVALRTNGATFGILAPAPGVYRGWLITMHNAKGERVGTACNQPEFGRLVP